MTELGAVEKLSDTSEDRGWKSLWHDTGESLNTACSNSYDNNNNNVTPSEEF